MTERQPQTSTERAAVSTNILDRYSADVIAASCTLFLLLAAVLLRFLYDNWLAEADLITFFIPWFGYIGDRLRDGDIPAWSNHYLGGIPVVGSPSSGWLYLPVMLLFPFLHVITAFKFLILVQAIIGGAFAYILARRVHLQPLAASAATLAFVLGPLLYASTRYTFIGSQVTSWIPMMLVAADLALGARRLSGLVAWSALAGLALSQIFVIWPGQGSLYGAMWVGGWMLYRLLADPFDPASTRLYRLWRCLLAGVVLGIVALGLSAAAVLPVLNISEQSTIPGGDYSGVLGGDYAAVPHQFKLLLYYMLADNFNIRAEGFGASICVLAVFGAILARRRYAAPFFATVTLLGLSLAVGPSPTQPIFDLIPVFAFFHDHRPIAIVWVLSLAPAMLVGAAVQSYQDRKYRPIPLLLLFGVILLFILLVSQVNSLGTWIGWQAYLTMIAAFAAIAIHTWGGGLRRWFSDDRIHAIGLAGLLAVIVIFPTGVDIVRTVIWPESPSPEQTKFLGRDEDTQDVVSTVLSRTGPGTAAEFLQQQQELLAPFRYTGYSSQGYPSDEYSWIYNTFWFRRMEPGVVGLLMNARTLRLDLEQTSGYNPVQLKAYADYIDVMNGARQDYHWSDTYAAALRDPDHQLLDMLNVRYILVDRTIPETREDHADIRANFTEVFRDEWVIVYENPDAFPRAWLVHDVFPIQGGEGLEAVNDGDVDARAVAYIDGLVPANLQGNLEQPTGQREGESVVVTDLSQERVALQVTAQDDGLVVVSATYADGWNAYVDGEKVELYQTNQAFQGIPVPAGDHAVELRYEPRSLTIGLYATGATAIGVLVIWGWAAADYRRGDRSGTPIRQRNEKAAA